MPHLDPMALSENRRMCRLMRHAGLPIESGSGGGVSTLPLRL